MNEQELNDNVFDFAKTLLDDNHKLSFRMQGYSMYPTLKPGDIGIVEKCSANEISVGDIIVFRQNKKLIAHRLIRTVLLNNHRIFITKGDKNTFTDAPFMKENVKGKIIFFQRGKRTIYTNNATMKYYRLLALRFSKIRIPFNNIMLRFSRIFNKMHSGLVCSLKRNLSLVLENSGKLIAVNAVIAVLLGILPFVVIVCIKLLTDSLTQISAIGNSEQLHFAVFLVITALVFLSNGVLGEIRNYFSEKLSQTVTRNIYDKLHLKHASLGLSHFENPKELDKIHRAVQEASFRPNKIINEALTGIRAIAASLFLVGIFVSIRWYLVVMLLIAIIPGIFIRLKFSRKYYNLKESQSTREREMYYFDRILTGIPFAKELKLFRFSAFFIERFKKNQDCLFNEKLSLQKWEMGWNILAQAFSILMIFLSLGYVSYLKISGEISIGTVVLFFFAFQRGYSVLNDLFRSFTQILEDNSFLNDFVDFLNMPAEQIESKASFSLKKEIRFENVSFSYEASKRDALSSVSLTIPVGKTVAIVGANGSGKTTLIKLLCGFYQPKSGKIFFDGTEASQIGIQEIRENIAAVFQDFALYNILAAYNITLGKSTLEPDIEKAKKAARSAGIANVLENLPNKYNTVLGNIFTGGEELSIGQWQKIAIARAFYRDAPLLLMDEPSSALDGVAEMQIIDTLKDLSHEKTSIIISHRLTTVQWVDLIYLFDKGQVVESGSHQELIALKGKYYTLFENTDYRQSHFNATDNKKAL